MKVSGEQPAIGPTSRQYTVGRCGEKAACRSPQFALYGRFSSVPVNKRSSSRQGSARSTLDFGVAEFARIQSTKTFPTKVQI